ncbi:MAG: HTH-type transcriptional repressor YvoA [Anaerolineales bacterium]|nr:HTH-type transcriptional repressor YvoA [Anaerolineales bacterium]
MSERTTLDRSDTIKKDSPLPLYFQLKELLRQEIEGGKWQPRQRLPSETELCQTFGISRTVVRQALRELEYEGLLYREQGKGTFVAEPKISESLMQDLSGFYEDMVAQGLTPVTKVLMREVQPATGKVADYLQVEPGDKVIVVERLRSIDDEPILLVTTYLPYDICPELVEEDWGAQSLYALLEDKYGFELSHGRRTIEAVAADQYESELLSIEEGAPLILLDSVSYLEDGRPIEYYHAVHRGDRSRFEVEVVRMRNGEPLAGRVPELPPTNSLRP